MMKRIAAIVAGAAVVVVAVDASMVASAATPGFEMGVETDVETLVVTVTFEPVPSGFAWGTMEASGVLDRLVGVLPADQLDEGGRPVGGSVPQLVRLERVSEGVYEGQTVVPHDGEWSVVAWPLSPDLNPQATPVVVVVGAGTPAIVWLGLGFCVFVVVFLVANRAKTKALLGQ